MADMSLRLWLVETELALLHLRPDQVHQDHACLDHVVRRHPDALHAFACCLHQLASVSSRWLCLSEDVGESEELENVVLVGSSPVSECIMSTKSTLHRLAGDAPH